jgi:hypothetical protein
MAVDRHVVVSVVRKPPFADALMTVVTKTTFPQMRHCSMLSNGDDQKHVAVSVVCINVVWGCLNNGVASKAWFHNHVTLY